MFNLVLNKPLQYPNSASPKMLVNTDPKRIIKTQLTQVKPTQ